MRISLYFECGSSTQQHGSPDIPVDLQYVQRGSGLGLCGLWGHLDLVNFRVLLLTLWESQPPCHLQAESCYHYIICFSKFPGHNDTIFQIRGWQSSALSSLCAVWSPIAGAHSRTWKARKVPSALGL